MSLRISPSILAGDFAHLADAVASVEAGGADFVHVDVMDGHFVPNITIGVPVVAALKRVTHVPLDVHLMISDPDRYLEDFVDAGRHLGKALLRRIGGETDNLQYLLEPKFDWKD